MTQPGLDYAGHARLREARTHLAGLTGGAAQFDLPLQHIVAACRALAFVEHDPARTAELAEAADDLGAVIERIHALCARAWGATREAAPPPRPAEPLSLAPAGGEQP